MLAYQFFRDLDPVFLKVKVTTLTDSLRMIGRHEDGRSAIYENERLQLVSGEPIIETFTDTGFAIVSQKGRRTVVARARPVQLVCSPIMTPVPMVVNESGYVGGYVLHGGVGFARVWDASGEMVFAVNLAESAVSLLPALGHSVVAGVLNRRPVVWQHREVRQHAGPGGESATLVCLNGAGMTGGFYLDGSRAVAMLWNEDANPVPLGLPDEGHQRVIAILEDETVLVEILEGTDRRYALGRPGEMEPFTSERIGSIESFPLVAIEAISPSGAMLVHLQEPSSGVVTKALIGPSSLHPKAMGE